MQPREDLTSSAFLALLKAFSTFSDGFSPQNSLESARRSQFGKTFCAKRLYCMVALVSLGSYTTLYRRPVSVYGS